MKSGDLLLFRPTGILGRIVCFFSSSEYCHVGLVYENHILEFMTNTGYRVEIIEKAIEEWGDNPDIYRCSFLDDFEIEDIIYEYKLLQDKPYGWYNVIRTGLLKLFPDSWFQNECDKYAPHCSQAVCKSFRLGGNLDLVPNKPDWRSTPGDIVKCTAIKKVIE
jgi:hypothetical protein